MNYLAHFQLAWPEEMLVVGGLEGDFHKGPLPGTLSPALLHGVALHRAIDAYTDSHPAMTGARALFPDGTRRYAGILLDLCFDYFLAHHWQDYSETGRTQFNETVYDMLDRHTETLSAPARTMAQRLRTHDLLGRYEHWDMITASAARVGQRLRHSNPLDRADELLSPLLPELEAVFRVFYPELLRFSRRNAMLAKPAKRTR